MNTHLIRCFGILAIAGSAIPARPSTAQLPAYTLDLPDREIVAAYERAATQNVLAAVNPKVFEGYWSVCADGIGFGYGNSYPSLDGHQMADALLRLGEVAVVKANWDYVLTFQRPDGQLPLAILPGAAGQLIGPPAAQSQVDPNGGLYRHWVPGDPLRALAGPTFIQNADVIFRGTQDRDWLRQQLPAINLTADHLASLCTPDGAVAGAGYYVERPTRIEYDGVAQCHAVDAFQRVAALNALVGNQDRAARYQELAERIGTHFRTRFWVQDHFAEYIHPERGVIASHGLTDVDWSAIATGVADAGQTATVWSKLKDEQRFYYGGMPTGIATLPESYEDWEFATNDRMDLAAMGRVWYLECWARARMGDAAGLVASIRKVSESGREHGYYWRERYTAKGPHGAEKYCEYPANLIRSVQRFLLGVDWDLDGTLTIAPVVPDEFWRAGFGQTLAWRERSLSYHMGHNHFTAQYCGEDSQRLKVRLPWAVQQGDATVAIDDRPVETVFDGHDLIVVLPAAAIEQPRRLEIRSR